MAFHVITYVCYFYFQFYLTGRFSELFRIVWSQWSRSEPLVLSLVSLKQKCCREMSHMLMCH